MIIVTGPAAAAARTDNYNEAGPLSAAVTMVVVVVAVVQHAKNIRPKVVAGMIYPATHFHGPSFFAGIRRASIIIEYFFSVFHASIRNNPVADAIIIIYKSSKFTIRPVTVLTTNTFFVCLESFYRESGVRP